MPTLSEQLQQLRLFNEKAISVRHSRFVEQVFRPNHGFAWITPGDGSMQTEWRGADDDATNALALNLRFFIWSQTRDRINLKQICETYGALPIGEADKQMVSELVGSLDETLDSTAVIIQEEKVTWRRLLEVFLYGKIAHVNRNERATYEKWTERESVATFLRYDFEEIVKAIIFAVCQIRHINERVIKALNPQYTGPRIQLV
jgi:hypothetical protein